MNTVNDFEGEKTHLDHLAHPDARLNPAEDTSPRRPCNSADMLAVAHHARMAAAAAPTACVAGEPERIQERPGAVAITGWAKPRLDIGEGGGISGKSGLLR